jgi:hypothetical protein
LFDNETAARYVYQALDNPPVPEYITPEYDMRHSKIYISVLLLACACIASCASGTKKTAIQKIRTLVGKWEGVDRTGKLGAFQFFEDGKVILIIDGKPLGGPDATALGMLKFTVDYQKDPIELDILGIDPSGTEHGKILMIVRFVSDDKIKIRTFFNDARPENFDEETIDDTIVLDRIN